MCSSIITTQLSSSTLSYARMFQKKSTISSISQLYLVYYNLTLQQHLHQSCHKSLVLSPSHSSNVLSIGFQQKKLRPKFTLQPTWCANIYSYASQHKKYIPLPIFNFTFENICKFHSNVQCNSNISHMRFTCNSHVNHMLCINIKNFSSKSTRGTNESDASTDTHNRPIVFAMKVKKGTSNRTNRKGQKMKVAKHRTKKPARLAKDTQGLGFVTAYSTAEEYNLEHLSLDLQAQGLFREAFMPKDAQDILHMQVFEKSTEEDEEPREMFLFREGSVVFWNVPESLVKSVIRTIAKHESHSYEIALVTWENEQMSYTYDSEATRIADADTIILHDNNDPETTVLEKFAFSNALALSVKLAIWEWSLDKFVTSIEWVPDNLKAGKKLKMSKEQVLRKLGELFSLRHRINLTSDLLISPDFYWNRDDLELMFTKTCNFLSISRRTKVLNEKLNHCSELVELMRTHLNEQHSFRLEWMIIALITVEVIFEIVHYMKLYVQENVDQTNLQYEPERTDELKTKSTTI